VSDTRANIFHLIEIRDITDDDFAERLYFFSVIRIAHHQPQLIAIATMLGEIRADVSVRAGHEHGAPRLIAWLRFERLPERE
jgi:hypothetical protein